MVALQIFGTARLYTKTGFRRYVLTKTVCLDKLAILHLTGLDLLGEDAMADHRSPTGAKGGVPVWVYAIAIGGIVILAVLGGFMTPHAHGQRGGHFASGAQSR